MRRWLSLAILLAGLTQAQAAPPSAELVAACYRLAEIKPIHRIDQWNKLIEKAESACPLNGVADAACMASIQEEEFYRAALNAAGPLLPRAQVLPRCEALKKGAR